jgi:hypothetical protein
MSLERLRQETEGLAPSADFDDRVAAAASDRARQFDFRFRLAARRAVPWLSAGAAVAAAMAAVSHLALQAALDAWFLSQLGFS